MKLTKNIFNTHLFVLVLTAVSLSYLGALINYTPAAAWCNNTNTVTSAWDDSHIDNDVAGLKDGQTPEDIRIILTDTPKGAECAQNNFKDFNANNPDRAITIDQYADMIHKCRNGEAAGPNDMQMGNCSNAAIRCLETAIDVASCSKPDVLASVAMECNYGRGWPVDYPSGDGNPKSCNPLREENKNQFNEADDTIAGGAYCDTSKIDPNDLAAIAKAKTDCKDEITKDCDYSWVTGNKSYKEADTGLGAYEQCLKDKSLETATEAECVQRGGGNGIWIDKKTKDPNGPNELREGCFNQASDLTNPQACEEGAKKTGRDFKWQRTDKPQTPATEAWGCVDPENPEGEEDKDDEEEKGDANTEGSVNKASQHCGQARVNLLSCGREEGATALNGILRIIIITLTVLVGVAAVGGLAWASLQYAKAEDNSGAVSEARTLIRNIVIGILLYGFLFVIINWLIPGGVIQ